MSSKSLKYFTQYQTDWAFDLSPLKIIEKSRQIGITYADAYNSVMLASDPDARLDVFASSRDEVAARLYLEDCKFWADFLHAAVSDLGEIDFDTENSLSAYALHFSNGRRIYCLSSNPNALAGKRGHVKLDEFALHKDQRLLYRIAKPVTMWGGSLSLISTHRGIGTLFNQLIRDITENGNPMGWSHHRVPIQKAVEQGIVERINKKTGRTESPEEFLQRLRKECIDEEQWLQEYCCTPADESAAFFSYEMLDACTDPNLKLLSLQDFLSSSLAASKRSEDGCAPPPATNAHEPQTPDQSPRSTNASASQPSTFNLQPSTTPTTNHEPRTTDESAIKIQNSKIENSPELCYDCAAPLPPLLPNGQRPLSTCRACGAHLYPPGTRFDECSYCRTLQPILADNQRPSTNCRQCRNVLPPVGQRFVTHCPACGTELPGLTPDGTRQSPRCHECHAPVPLLEPHVTAPPNAHAA